MQMLTTEKYIAYRTICSWTIWSWTIIWKNILTHICSMTIFEMDTAPGVYSKHAPGPGAVQCELLYLNGAVCIQIMLLEHI